MLTVEQAKAKILEGAEAVAEVEDMVTLYSAGKILAQDIVSEIKVPPLDNSQMDGYAVRCADFAGGRRNFPVSQRIFAGHVGTELEPDTVARIFTGAPIPPGADAVIPQEEASEMEDGSVEFHCDPKAGAWIRRAGCDIDVGQTVLKKGDRLTPPALGVAASIGVSTVKVYRPIRVSLFFTGDELAMPGEKLVEGGIYNSNRFVLRGLLHQLGCDVVDYGNIPDTFEATLEAEKDMARAVAKLTYAFANASVPKVNVIVGKAYGSAYIAMNSKSIGADLVYAWPTAEIGMMDANQAAKIMYADADAATIREKAAEYKNLQSSPLSAAKRGYVDTIIEAADTRKYVIGAFEMLFTKREDRPAKKHGTV